MKEEIVSSDDSFDGPPLPDPGPPFDDDEFMRGVYKEAGEIWDILSKEDVSAYTKNRNGLSYLSWASAWGVMMKHFPGFEVEFDKVSYLPDETATVRCRVQVRSICRDMWLPVMDYKHKAIVNPSSRDISDSKMRCMTKCMALFGLGHYIYDGEDLPPESEKRDPAPKGKKTKKKTKEDAKESVTNGDADSGYNIAMRELLFDKEVLNDFADIVSLNEYYVSRKREMDKLKATNPETYEECLAAFGERKRQIQEGK